MSTHFDGKDILAHMKQARKKGFLASRENHALVPSDAWLNYFDAIKENAVVILIFWCIQFSFLSLPHSSFLFSLFMIISGLALWKMGRSAGLSWSRLERIQQLIREEQKEIKTNREEEQMELKEIYRMKGFSEPLLTQIVNVLMSDDSKLLGIMLEEELGISLQPLEHPIKQITSTGLGVLSSGIILCVIAHLFPSYGIPITSCCLISIASLSMSYQEKTCKVQATIWYLSTALLTLFSLYFLAKFYISYTSNM